MSPHGAPPEAPPEAAVAAPPGAEAELIDRDIEAYLARHERKELVRFVAVGSVDDGKSTLIGRLLHDTHGIYEDQLAAVKRATRGDEEIDFALFTDGLKAEREQGITIDVAYRYFSTERRKFILADTPGHVQYTRNMATGASTADVAIILLDARLGVLPQSRRHAYIASLLGIPQLLVAVNKMDLVEYDEAVFTRLSREFGPLVGAMGFEGVRFVPISARRGDNVVHPSARTPWFDGGTVLSFLEEVPVQRSREAEPVRLPVQYVIRPHLDYRGFAGQIASGVLRAGQEVVVLPSGRRARVKAIDTWEGELAAAQAPLSVTVRLDREIDVSRGDVLASVEEPPRVERRFEAMLVWLSERPFDPARALLLKHTTRVVPARLERVLWRMDLEALRPVPAGGLALNDIGKVAVRASRPLFVDAYRDNRVTGAFILIDALANDTVAAGMIVAREDQRQGGLDDDEGADGPGGAVGDGEREARLGQRGAVLWLDEAAAAPAVERALFDRGVACLVVEGAELGEEAAREVIARCAGAGLAVIAVGVAEAVRVAVAARLGDERCASAPVDEAAALLVSLTALP